MQTACVWNQVLVGLLVLGRDGAPRTLTSTTERVSWLAPARFFASPSVSAFSCCSAVPSRRGCKGDAWSDGVDYPWCPDGDVCSVTLARSRRLALSTPAYRQPARWI